MLRRFVRNEEAVTATEYAVMLAMIVLAAVYAIEALGNRVSDTFMIVSDDMPLGD
jgi:Flp pilus assembly pilin Flp